MSDATRLIEYFAGQPEAAAKLARDRRLLQRAMPATLPPEPWFADAPPPADDLVSLIILCCDQLEITRLCVESVLANTRRPFELIFVDNGSADGTPEYLAGLTTHPAPARVEVIRNDTNRGYPAGCNQGLVAARGPFVLFLNNDTVLPPDWLEGLIGLMVAGGPPVGLVGPVTNYAPEPQQVAAGYDALDGLAAFAAKRRREFAGRVLEMKRATGFCLLARRSALDAVGALDERFGVGFFDDDDLCLRMRQAGRKILVALDTYIHHFGSRTFRGLGIDTRRQLEENFGRFRAKWG
jgi:GT2 family glycosyltransferase